MGYVVESPGFMVPAPASAPASIARCSSAFADIARPISTATPENASMTESIRMVNARTLPRCPNIRSVHRFMIARSSSLDPERLHIFERQLDCALGAGTTQDDRA